LRRLLFNREPSGLFEVRIRSIHALAKLGARDVLLDFLRTRQALADPVEQLGEDAVISAAAQALADYDEAGVFDALMELAKRPCLAGVIFAVGASRRPEAIPVLVRALSEDTSRLTAERALIAIGEAAQSTLIEVATNSSQNSLRSESHLRQRRSALRLLAQMDVSPPVWRKLRDVLDDSDPKTAIVICTMAFRSNSSRDKRRALQRLLLLFAKADCQEREDIRHCLIENAATVRAMMQQSTSLTGHRESEAASFVRRIIG
jgi:hypothetical protein